MPNLNAPWRPPYYAFRRHAQIGNEFLATVDGLWTDERQNVLDMDKEPIPGLYATGNCCGRRWGACAVCMRQRISRRKKLDHKAAPRSSSGAPFFCQNVQFSLHSSTFRTMVFECTLL